MTKQSLSGIGIAITRPLGQAGKLSALIEGAGGVPILFPLIEIVPLNSYSAFEQVISQIDRYDWAIFISSNAVQNGMPHLINQSLVKKGLPPNLKFAAIGPTTAAELSQFGAKNVVYPQDKSDSEALLALPEMQAVAGKQVMIFRGVGGREILADTLKARGAQVVFAECYQRICPQTNADQLANLYAQKQLHGIVVTSSEAMRCLLDLAKDAAWLKHTPIFVNHARVAEEALKLGLQAHVAEIGGDAAMLNCLKQYLDC